MSEYYNESIKKIYDSFCSELVKEKNKENILILFRGECKDFAFKYYNLDPLINSIELFAERLFFYGCKAKYFWDEKMKSKKENFAIDDISTNFSKYIFKEFSDLIKNASKDGTKAFFNKNKNAVEFFDSIHNIEKFVNAIESLEQKKKYAFRNYYLILLHQLGDEAEYKENSHFVSTTKKKVK